ncbi:hypothetical protein E0Z10_g10446 [Xylaria hypoxylon]|uniref:NAD-dependent epimerase/dehydratase domain-containing protein n=1 Tax=Xylaria hypoxylon TaxID=37992 RepID=A0A4Z0YHC2_9PEZI|nr:hypothetical protein E0Z10_g10446 [Xylaria hypoxylon]
MAFKIFMCVFPLPLVSLPPLNCRKCMRYVAGDVLYVLARKYPGFEYAALVRSENSAARVREAYPNVRVVLGSLDDADLLKREAAWADLVLRHHNNAADASDHESAARAIAAGLVEGHTESRPGYWLHTGGTGILTYFDTVENRFGEPPGRIFDDLDGVEVLTSFPDEAFHRNVDKVVLECGTAHADMVRTAIVCPPTIYGNGRGPVSGRSRQCYEMAKVILTKGYVPIVGTGLATMDNVHIQDLTQAYILLIEAALAGNASPELWGARGYLVAATGEHVWGPLARTMAAKTQEMGLLKGDGGIKEYQMSKEEALETAGFEALSWGLNSRCKGRRLNKFLGWKAEHPSLNDEVPGIVRSEAKRLGLL